MDTAARENQRPPPSLMGYRARIESELSLILRDTLGREHVAQVEELALAATWRRGVEYDLHVLGYRSASVGVPYSALSFTRSWTVPSLYGDRLTLGVDLVRFGGQRGPDPSGRRAERDSTRSSSPASMPAVHPLSLDRERFYRFQGGDTIAFVRSGGRVVPIARVEVKPVLDRVPIDSTTTLFEGEIDFDASRHQIVRMRGRFVTRLTTRRGLLAKLAQIPGVVAVAYVEFVNAEVDGRYWLPQYQRTEFQATIAALGRQRSVFRLVSRFDDLNAEIDSVSEQSSDSGGAPPDAVRVPASRTGGDTVGRTRRTLSYANTDSISRYRGWIRPLGTATAAVSASDFDDYLPDPWRPSGPPRFELAPATLDEVFRFDRVEGAFSGTAVALRFRDAAPGLSARAFGGWAWREHTARGGGSVSVTRGPNTLAVRGERLLATTNDFTPPLESGTIGFEGLFGADDQDYVDRRLAALSLTRLIGSVRTALASVEGGVGDDRSEVARLTGGLFGAGSFRPNRASADGRYLHVVSTLELHPDVSGLFLEPGAGLTASYEVGRGQLNWQRAELTLALRRGVGDLTLAARAQGGVVAGRAIPPQQLFELGGEEVLPGYAYKQFAGDRAAFAGALVSYPFPILRRPWRVVRSLVVPGLSPGFAAGIRSGWAEASSERVLAAIRKLDPLAPASCAESPSPSCPSPLSAPTGRIRATVDLRLTVFGGLLGFGLARPIDEAAPWRVVFRLGQDY
jgi:hypothetical protein